MTPFDFLRLVHDKKIKWEDLNEDEQKTYNKFIINRALGFNNNMLDIVNRLQGYDVTPKESFKYYQSMTGDKFRFNKWIKGNKMGFAGLKDEKDRASVILYLNQIQRILLIVLYFLYKNLIFYPNHMYRSFYF